MRLRCLIKRFSAMPCQKDVHYVFQKQKFWRHSQFWNVEKPFGGYLGSLDSCDWSFQTKLIDSILIFLIAESNILSTEPLQSHQYLYSWAAHFYIRRRGFVKFWSGIIFVEKWFEFEQLSKCPQTVEQFCN